MKRAAVVSILTGCLVFFLSCGGKSPKASGLSFRLPTLDGDTVSFDDFKGKVVLLDFWATWCPPCRAYIPYLIEFHNKYSNQGLVVIGISNDDIGAMKSFKTSQQIPYLLLVSDNETLKRYGITAIPTTYVFDRKGKFVKKEIGFNPAKLKVFEEDLKKLLNE